jgi:hypothetical protein
MSANTTFPSLLRFYVLIQALTFSMSIIAQPEVKDDLKPSFSIGIQTFSGFIIPHSESIRSISNSNPWGVEVSLGWHFSDPKSQSYCNCFPRAGVALSYVNFDNPAILGEGFTIAPYIEPFIAPWKTISYSVRFSAGAAYLNKIYDRVTNPENLFYSKQISYILSLTPSIVYSKSENLKFRLSGSYNHISNGGNRQPNKGINFPVISLGFDYIFRPVDFSKNVAYQFDGAENKNSIDLILLGTAKTPDFRTTGREALFGLNVSYQRNVGRISNLIFGAEWVNDQALKAELSRNYQHPPDHKRAALLVGHSLSIGKFSFSQQLGVYIYSPAKAKDPVYQRWGLNYQLNEKLFLGINLKAHRHVADFLDLRMGYRNNF